MIQFWWNLTKLENKNWDHNDTWGLPRSWIFLIFCLRKELFECNPGRTACLNKKQSSSNEPGKKRMKQRQKRLLVRGGRRGRVIPRAKENPSQLGVINPDNDIDKVHLNELNYILINRERRECVGGVKWNEEGTWRTDTKSRECTRRRVLLLSISSHGFSNNPHCIEWTRTKFACGLSLKPVDLCH